MKIFPIRLLTLADNPKLCPKILADCHRQFSSFRPVTAESYRHDIQAVINMVLIGWLQLRNTYVDLKERKEHGHEAK